MTAVAAAEMFAHFRDGNIQMAGYHPSVVIPFRDLPYGMVLIQFFGSEMTDGVGLAAGQGACLANEVVPERYAREHQANEISLDLEL
jgi:hypothetical protein